MHRRGYFAGCCYNAIGYDERELQRIGGLHVQGLATSHAAQGEDDQCEGVDQEEAIDQRRVTRRQNIVEVDERCLPHGTNGPLIVFSVAAIIALKS